MARRSLISLQDLALCVILVGASVAVYASTLDADFVYDDFDSIHQNPALHWNELSLGGLVESARASTTTRPISIWSFGLNYYFARLDPAPYHATGIAVHAANVALAYCLLVLALASDRGPGAALRPAARRVAAAAGAAIFALHPLQTQSVAYVVQRMTTLAAFFSLLALLCFALAARAPSSRRRWLLWCVTVAAVLLAVGAKESAVVAPAAIGLWAWCFGPAPAGRAGRDLDPHIALRWGGACLALLVVGAAAAWAVGFDPLARYVEKDFTLGERLLTQPRVLALYASLVLLPLPGRLSLVHPIATSHGLFDPPSTAFALIGLFGVLAFAFAVVRRQRLIGFGVLWCLLQLAVESSVLPLVMANEHRLYLPLFGVGCIAAGLVSLALAATPRALPGYALLVLVIASMLGTAAHARARVWVDAEALWRDTLTKAPDDVNTRINLSHELLGGKAYPEVIALVGPWLRDGNTAIELYGNLASAQMRTGDFAGAVETYRSALAREPQSGRLLQGLARALAASGDTEAAVVAFRAALERREEGRVLHELARLEAQLGRESEADAAFRRAVELQPERAGAWIDWARLSAAMGEPELALARVRQGLAQRPEARGFALESELEWEAGRQARALELIERALAVEPDSREAQRMAAWQLATTEVDALRDYERAFRIARDLVAGVGRDDAQSYDALGAAQAARGRFKQAQRSARRAARLATAEGDLELAAAALARARGYERGFVYRERVESAGGSERSGASGNRGAQP